MSAEMWLGYGGLSVPPASVSALVRYEPGWDRRIVQSYGSVPPYVEAVVLLRDGRALPAQRPVADLRRQLQQWQDAIEP